MTKQRQLAQCWRWLVTMLLASACYGQIESRGSTSAPATQPLEKSLTRVTMKCDEAPAQQVFGELARLGDLELVLPPAQSGVPEPVTLNATNQPFWSVFLNACGQTGLGFRASDPSHPRRIQLTHEPDCRYDKLPVSQAHGCTVAALMADCDITTDFGTNNAPSRTFLLHLLMMIDPTCRLSEDSVSAQITGAVDDNGMSLLPGGEATIVSSGQWNAQAHWAYTTLKYPTRTSRRIATLEGVLRIENPVKEETWEIDDVLNAKPQTRNVRGRTITIQSIKKTQPRYYEVHIIWQTTPAAIRRRRSPEDSLWEFTRSMAMYAADGTRLSGGSGGIGTDQCDRGFATANEQVQPVKLVWKVPLEVEVTTMPFVLKDLAIP